MTRYGYLAQLRALPGKADELIALLLSTGSNTQAMAGCRLYAVARDAHDEHLIHISEIWDSKQAHDDSLKQPGVRAIITQAMPLLDGMPQKGIEMEVIGGIGVPG